MGGADYRAPANTFSQSWGPNGGPNSWWTLDPTIFFSVSLRRGGPVDFPVVKKVPGPARALSLRRINVVDLGGPPAQRQNTAKTVEKQVFLVKTVKEMQLPRTREHFFGVLGAER